MKRALLPLTLLLAACAADQPTPDPSPNVVLETELGEIEIEVYPDAAPISAADFLLHVDEGLYDNEGFYRVVRADNDPRGMGMSLIQGGILGGEMERPLIAHERTTDTGLSNVRGVVSIARLEPGTGSAGFFFINIGDNSFLDTGGERNPDGEGYATFGKVVRGMDVVEAIQAMDASGESPEAVTANQYLTEPVIITRAYRVSDNPQNEAPARKDPGSVDTLESLSDGVSEWRAVSHSDWDFEQYPSLGRASLRLTPVGDGFRISTDDGCNGGSVIRQGSGDPAIVTLDDEGRPTRDHAVVATEMGCYDGGLYIGLDMAELASTGANWSLKGNNLLTIQTDGATATFIRMPED